MSDNAIIVKALDIVLAKLDEVNAKISALDKDIKKLSYDGEKTQKRLGAVIHQYTLERERCEILEITNRSNVETITHLRSRLAHAWDKTWLMEANNAGRVKAEESEVALGGRDNAGNCDSRNDEGRSNDSDEPCDVEERTESGVGVSAEELREKLWAVLEAGR